MDQEASVLCMLDARKQRVYAARYDGAGELAAGPGDVGPSVALDWMDGPFRATGEGALVYRDLVEAAGGVVVPDADHPAVATLALTVELGSNFAWDPCWFLFSNSKLSF